MFLRSTVFALMAAAGALCGVAQAGATDTSVAFVSIRSGDAHIYVRDAQGDERMLTSGKGVNTQPAWSSTGKLAFSRRVGALNKIHVVNEDGSGLRQVTDSARGEAAPSWSPDGRALAYYSTAADSPQTELRITQVASGATVIVTGQGTAMGPSAPMWSADGKRLALIAADAKNVAQVWIVEHDGSGFRDVSGQLAKRGAGWASLAPDGQRVVWVGDMRGTWPIIVTDLKTGESKDLTVGGTASHESPRWSPDGRQIVFASNRDDPGGGRNDIFVMDADGTNVRNLSRHAAEDFDPKWSPDGRSIVFASLRTGTSLLYEVDLATGTTHPFAQHKSHDMDHVVRPLAALH